MSTTEDAIQTLLLAKKRIVDLETALKDCVDADSEPYGGTVHAEAIYRARQLLTPPPEGWTWTTRGWEFSAPQSDGGAES